MPSELDTRLAGIRLAAFDVDGVFTDGTFTLDGDGRDAVRFHVRDGLGVKLLLEAGYRVAIVSGRDSRAGRIRMERLGVPIIRFAVGDKGAVLRSILEEEAVERERVLFMGDDLSDLPAFALAGIRVAVPDAAPEVVARADLVTDARGGAGAVREISDRLLKASGRWSEILERHEGARE